MQSDAASTKSVQNKKQRTLGFNKRFLYDALYHCFPEIKREDNAMPTFRTVVDVGAKSVQPCASTPQPGVFFARPLQCPSRSLQTKSTLASPPSRRLHVSPAGATSPQQLGTSCGLGDQQTILCMPKIRCILLATPSTGVGQKTGWRRET